MDIKTKVIKTLAKLYSVLRIFAVERQNPSSVFSEQPRQPASRSTVEASAELTL